MFLPQCQWNAGMDKLSGHRKATPFVKDLERENCISHDSWQMTRCISTYSTVCFQLVPILMDFLDSVLWQTLQNETSLTGNH